MSSILTIFLPATHVIPIAYKNAFYFNQEIPRSLLRGYLAKGRGGRHQGDRTNLIILLPRSKIGSPVTNEAGLEPDTWARAPRWRAWQAAPPRWHGHPDGLRSAHLGSSPLVRGSWWRPQRRRCATGSVVLLGWCDHPVSNCRGPHPTFVSPAATSPSVAVTGISAKEGQSSDTDGAAGAAD